MSIEKISESRVKLTIEVSLEDWKKALDQAFEKIVKKVKVDGFRPGKLPKTSYIKRFGYESLYEEALNFAFNASYPKAVREHEVIVVSQPTIDLDFNALSPDQGFTYTAEVDIVPPVHLGEYKGIKVTTLSKEVTPEEVENEVKRLLERKAENEIKEGPAELGDTVVIDFEGFIDDVAFEGGKGVNHPLELGSHSFIPGFEEQLVGKSAGENCDVQVTFPEEYHAKDLAGKAATFKVTVHEVKRKVIPEWNDEFVQELEIENVNTVEEHREYIVHGLKHQKEHAYEHQLEHALIDKVVDDATVDIPESMIQETTENIKNNVKKQADQYKIPFELYLQYMQLTPEKFEEDARKAAIRNIKEDLVLTEIAKVENLKIEMEDIEQEYEKIAHENHMDVKKVKEQLKGEQILYRAERSKVLQYLKDNAILD